MWTYSQSTGKMTDSFGKLFCLCYSGGGDGLNNPLFQGLKGIGPIPKGKWRITEIYDSDRVGRFALKLEPATGTKTFDRAAFRIHGDNNKKDKSGSDGCIVMDRLHRCLMWDSGDHDLLVIA